MFNTKDKEKEKDKKDKKDKERDKEREKTKSPTREDDQKLKTHHSQPTIGSTPTVQAPSLLPKSGSLTPPAQPSTPTSSREHSNSAPQPVVTPPLSTNTSSNGIPPPTHGTLFVVGPAGATITTTPGQEPIQRGASGSSIGTTLSYKPGPGVSASEHNMAVLRGKLEGLPKETRVLVDSLLGLLGKAAIARQQQIQSSSGGNSAPEPPAIGEQLDVIVEKLVETSELLFNKDHHSMLKRLSKELIENPDTRGDKWRRWVRMFDQDKSFSKEFLLSPAFEASIRSSCVKPLVPDEADLLLEILGHTLIPEIDRKELLELIKSFSNSAQHVPPSTAVDLASSSAARNLPECVVSLVLSFKINPDGIPTVAPPRESESTSASTHSVSLFNHVATINHMKLGTEQSRPLFLFFKREIQSTEKSGKEFSEAENKAKKEKNTRLEEISNDLRHEDEKLKLVQAEIADLKAKLKGKKEEEKTLLEQKATKEKDREQFEIDQDKKIREILSNVSSNNVQLENHQKTSEWLARFVAKISQSLESEITECISKTNIIIGEQEKEMAFLEEKMASYERSISLFSKDEPELMGGLRKLFDRCQNIYSDSKETTARVQAVLTLLKKVQTGKDQKPLDDLQTGVDKIFARQQALGKNHKLQ